MGQQHSCNKLNEFGNVCEIHNCIKLVRGLSSNSASPSDTWILTFKDGAKYENDNIQKGFLKFFIDPGSLPPGYNSVAMGMIQGLDYEIKVYRDIVRPLVDYNVCPNFIRYLGSGTSCIYDSMIQILDGKTYNSSTKDLMDRNDLINSFQDNFYHMYEREGGRQSINTNTNTPPSTFIKSAKYFKYNLLVNETITNDAYTLFEHLKRLNGTGTRFRQADWCIIFQIIIACYSMSLSKTNHNDLHAGNIYIEPYNKPLNYLLTPNRGVAEVCSVNCGNIVKLYDFDRAYCERLGGNPLLEPHSGLDQYSQSNEFIPTKDMIKVFGYIWDMSSQYESTIIQKIIAKPGKERFLFNVYSKGMFLQRSDGSPLTRQDYERNFNTAEEILMNVAKLSGSGVKNSDDREKIYKDTDNLYVCGPEVFNPDGSFKGLSMATQASFMKQYLKAEQQINDKELIYNKCKDRLDEAGRLLKQKDEQMKRLLKQKDEQMEILLKQKDEQMEKRFKLKDEESKYHLRQKDDEYTNLLNNMFRLAEKKDIEIQQLKESLNMR